MLKWLPLCVTPVGLESEPAVCQVSTPHTVLCLFIPVAIFENAYLDYIHLCWIVCPSVPLPLFISMLEWLCIPCVAFTIHSDLMLPVLIIYSTSNGTKKASPLWLVTSDLSLQKTKWPRMFFFTSAPTASGHLLALPIAPCLCSQAWSKILEHKWMLWRNCYKANEKICVTAVIRAPG